MKRWMFGWWLALAAVSVHAAEMTMTIYPASVGLAAVLKDAPTCLAGAGFSWRQQDGAVRNARSGAFVVVRNGLKPEFDGVYRIVAVAQSVTDGRIETLFRAECTTKLS